jgi:hypothetical protein
MYIGHTKLDSWSETRCAEWLLLLPLMGVVRLPEIWTRKTRDRHLQSGWLTATQWYDLYVWTVLRNEWYADLGGAWMCRCNLESRRTRRRRFTVLIGNSCRARFHGGGGGCPLTSFCRNEITTHKLFGISVCCSMVSFTSGKQNQTQKAQLPKSCTGWINPQRDRQTDRDFHKILKVLLLSQLSKYWAPGSVLTANQWMNLVCFW